MLHQIPLDVLMVICHQVTFSDLLSLTQVHSSLRQAIQIHLFSLANRFVPEIDPFQSIPRNLLQEYSKKPSHLWAFFLNNQCHHCERSGAIYLCDNEKMCYYCHKEDYQINVPDVLDDFLWEGEPPSLLLLPLAFEKSPNIIVTTHVSGTRFDGQNKIFFTCSLRRALEMAQDGWMICVQRGWRMTVTDDRSLVIKASIRLVGETEEEYHLRHADDYVPDAPSIYVADSSALMILSSCIIEGINFESGHHCTLCNPYDLDVFPCIVCTHHVIMKHCTVIAYQVSY
jgi:hypothetical protein